jgi:cation transport protein ChaC
MSLTREKIQSGWIRTMVEAGDRRVRILSDEELRATRDHCLAQLDPTADVWVFGYGSLIWNPCFEFAERRVAEIVGWHRRFCLWTQLGRGTPDRPGLMLGLERGGSCRGLAFRIPRAAIESELDVVWRREMVTGAYVPTVVRAATRDARIQAIAFTINRAHERYAGKLGEAEIVRTIACAEGPIGTNREYLWNTVEHLEALGLADLNLRRLNEAVQRFTAGEIGLDRDGNLGREPPAPGGSDEGR